MNIDMIVESISKQEALSGIIETLQNGLDKLQEPKNITSLLDKMVSMPSQSLVNLILIEEQAPFAKLVASAEYWKNNNRELKKNQTGIEVIIPLLRHEEVIDKEGNKVQKEVLKSKIGYVYDRTQTVGKEMDFEFPTPTAEDNRQLVYDLKEAVSYKHNIMQRPDIKQNGLYNPETGEIYVNEILPDDMFVKVAFHEIAHKKTIGKDISKVNDRESNEVIAESIAYVCCKYYGFDTSQYSFNYIKKYEKHDEHITNKLDLIRKTALDIVDETDQKLFDLHYVKRYIRNNKQNIEKYKHEDSIPRTFKEEKSR